MKQRVDQVRVFISDAEVVYLKGLRWALSEIDSFEVIGEATSNAETLESILKTPVDLLILNTNHSKPSGIDITRYVSHRLPNIKVIQMMDEYSTEQVVRAMKSGAKTCVSKSIDLDSLLLIVNQVMQDELPISHYLLEPKVADYILKEYEISSRVTNETEKSHIKFVQSEVMILGKIKDDTSLNNIATRLGISEKIVADYLDEIAEKLVRNEYYNESLEQRYINDLITRSAGNPDEVRKKQSDDRNSNFQAEKIESYMPDDLLQNIGVPFYVEDREKKKVTGQSFGLNERVTDISEAIDLARKAGRLSTVQDVNQYIINITEDLMTEIDHKRRTIRRIKKAIEAETALVKTLDIT